MMGRHADDDDFRILWLEDHEPAFDATAAAERSAGIARDLAAQAAAYERQQAIYRRVNTRPRDHVVVSFPGDKICNECHGDGNIQGHTCSKCHGHGSY